MVPCKDGKMFSSHGLLPAVSAMLLFLVPHTAFGSRTDKQLGPGLSDILEVFARFTDCVAVRDVNPDPMFKCLIATRVQFDVQNLSFAYRWSLNVDGDEKTKHPVLHYSPGGTLGTFTTVVNSDVHHPDQAILLYSDLKTCIVWELNYFGHQCTLWVLPENRDSISQECLDNYAEVCGKGVSLYEKGVCNKIEA